MQTIQCPCCKDILTVGRFYKSGVWQYETDRKLRLDPAGRLTHYPCAVAVKVLRVKR